MKHPTETRMTNPVDRFTWRSYDLNSMLPKDWQSAVISLATKAQPKDLIPNATTSREGDPTAKIEVRITDGIQVKAELLWLYKLYKGLFRDFAQLSMNEPISTAENDRYGVVTHLQRGTKMRFDVHLDSNPLEGLLYATDHPKGSGGELVVANNPSAGSLEEVEEDCTIIYPVAGNLLFLDGRRFPHYVRPLKRETDIRVVIAMNFYTPSCPESARPKDLDALLFGPANEALETAR